MKIVKNILIIVILVAIVGIIPILMYNKTSNTTTVLDKVEGTGMVGVSGYFSKIASDSNSTQEIKDNASKMVKSTNKIIEFKNKTYGMLVIYLSIIVDLLLLVFGMFLKKSASESKIGFCMVCSSILGIISTAYILISTIITNVAV